MIFRNDTIIYLGMLKQNIMVNYNRDGLDKLQTRCNNISKQKET